MSFFLMSPFQCHIRTLTGAIRQKEKKKTQKKIKGIQIEKKELKLSMFTDDVSYVKNSKE